MEGSECTHNDTRQQTCCWKIYLLSSISTTLHHNVLTASQLVMQSPLFDFLHFAFWRTRCSGGLFGLEDCLDCIRSLLLFHFLFGLVRQEIVKQAAQAELRGKNEDVTRPWSGMLGMIWCTHAPLSDILGVQNVYAYDLMAVYNHQCMPRLQIIPCDIGHSLFSPSEPAMTALWPRITLPAFCQVDLPYDLLPVHWE